MKAAVYRGLNDLRVEEIPRPEPGKGELLVRVDVCGVCLTDVKKVKKGLLPAPRVFGHEICGTIVGVGAGASDFQEGERVTLQHHVPCGACFYCRERHHAQCESYKRTGTSAGFAPAGGGYAEYVKVMDWVVAGGVIRVPEGVPAEEAAFVEPVNTCLKAVRRAGIRKGQSVLVVGQGSIGLLLLQLARREGALVFGSDPLQDRRAWSRELGASEVFDSADEDLVARVRAATSGRGADVTLLAALGRSALTQSLDATRPGGRILVFSATSPGELLELDLGALCVAEKQILTSYSSSTETQDEAARVVFDREIQVACLISHRLPLAEAPRAFELAARAEPGVLKVVLDMHGGS
jgi:L-iditol 2-dehydrogenase